MEKSKVLPLDEALEKAIHIFATLQDGDCGFLYCRKPMLEQMVFTASNDCDLAKVLVPEFEIKRDTRQDRYAELVIEYEST